MPLQTHLPASNLRQRCWPAPAGLFDKAEELRPPGHLRARREVRGLRGPCHLRSAQGVVLHVSPNKSSLNFGGNGAEEWWKVSARTMRTVCRSCFNHERSRRSRRRLAALGGKRLGGGGCGGCGGCGADVVYDVRVYPCTPTVMQLIKTDRRQCSSPFGWTDQPEHTTPVPSEGRFQASPGAKLT